MGFITERRTALAEALTAAHGDNFTVYEYNPELLNIPCAIILYGSPLLQDGDTFNSVNIRFTVTLVPGVGTNDVATDELSGLIEDSVIALYNGDFATEQVAQPYMLAANGGTYLAVDASVVTVAEIN